MKKKKEKSLVLEIPEKRAKISVSKGNIKTGPNHALLLKYNEMRCLIPIRSIEVDINVPVRPQIEKWASENGLAVAEHDEYTDVWACISKLSKDGSKPSNRVRDLRKFYQVKYLSYLVARHNHQGKIDDDNPFMFSPWIEKQWEIWARETRNLIWVNEMYVPHWKEEDHAEFDQWLSALYLKDDDFEVNLSIKKMTEPWRNDSVWEKERFKK
jgi:hypothetical protein